jgi:hypothetical protein
MRNPKTTLQSDPNVPGRPVLARLILLVANVTHHRPPQQPLL